MTEITGRYRLVNDAYLREKANQSDDPRHVFYVAMLTSRTYEEYLARIANMKVSVASYKTGPIDGRMEILYCRRNGRIADVK